MLLRSLQIGVVDANIATFVQDVCENMLYKVMSFVGLRGRWEGCRWVSTCRVLVLEICDVNSIHMARAWSTVLARFWGVEILGNCGLPRL